MHADLLHCTYHIAAVVEASSNFGKNKMQDEKSLLGALTMIAKWRRLFFLSARQKSAGGCKGVCNKVCPAPAADIGLPQSIATALQNLLSQPGVWIGLSHSVN